ncbi:MAG: hypothetical protein FRX49_04545 [Trebouxia sp. A1-2]|nr:MAG: hypothetical protein FRX49_04545 [Trebouxia sp. A1-2]
MRTSGSTVGQGAVPVSRQFALRRPSVQLHFSRSFLTQESRQPSFPVRAEDSDTTQIGQTDQSSASAATQLLGGDEQQPFPGVQSESGVELISQAIPTEAVLSASVTETNSRPAGSTDSTSDNWEPAFQSFIDVISKGEHFEGRTPTAKAFTVGVLKRGVLNFARSRQDILFSLPADKIQAVLAAGLPYQERKLTVATRRLSTTFGEEKGFLGKPEGSFQDLTRLVIAAAYSYALQKGRPTVDRDVDLIESHQYNEGLITAVAAVLPDIVAAASQEPSPEAQAQADASALVREQKAITPQPSDFRPSNSQGPSQDKRQDRSRFFMEKGWDGFEKPGIEVKPGDWVCAECSQHNFARNSDCFKCGASKMDAALPANLSSARRTPDRRARTDSFSERPPQTEFFSDRRSQTDGFSDRRERRSQSDSFSDSAASVSEGDWGCSECGTSNFARRGKCFKCGRPRSKGLAEGQKPGDWTCPSCSANNFSRRTDCFRCNTPKPEDQGYRAQSRRDSFADTRSRSSSSSNFERPVYEAKPGDWDCTACGASNFARRGLCFKCGEPRTGDSSFGGSSGASSSGRSAGRVFDNKQEESSWFDADEASPSSSPSTSSWDPRTSLGTDQPHQEPQAAPRSVDRDAPRRAGPQGGSEWERGGATMNRGGRAGSSRGGGSSFGRGGKSFGRDGGSSARGGGSFGRGGGSSSRGGGSFSRGGASSVRRGGSSTRGRGSADSKDGRSFSGYSKGRDVITGEPLGKSINRSFSEDSFGGNLSDSE